MARLGDNALGNKTIGGGSTAAGTTGTSIPTFSPPRAPSYVLDITRRRQVERYDSIRGHEQILPRGLRGPRAYSAVWRALSKAHLDEIKSFFWQFEGLGGPFFWTPPPKVFDPTKTPVALDETAGGSAGLRTLNVQFTWYSNSEGGLESAPSDQQSLQVSANNLLVVSLPVYPSGVDRVRVYVGTGTPELQATVQDTEWTEPTSGLISGANPPASSDLKVPLRFMLESDFDERLVRFDRYDLALEFVEQFI